MPDNLDFLSRSVYSEEEKSPQKLVDKLIENFREIEKRQYVNYERLKTQQTEELERQRRGSQKFFQSEGWFIHRSRGVSEERQAK
jgi:hypothetical protein